LLDSFLKKKVEAWLESNPSVIEQQYIPISRYSLDDPIEEDSFDEPVEVKVKKTKKKVEKSPINNDRKRKANFYKRNRAILLNETDGQCSNCESLDEPTVDHIIPLSKGGGNDLENLRVLCWPCHEWLNKYEQLPIT